MATPATYVDSLTNLMPLLIAMSTLFTAIISSIGLLISRRTAVASEKNSKAIGEIHLIVNSQRTEMTKEIDILKVKCNILEASNIELKKMILDMPKVLLVAKESELSTTRALVEIKPVENKLIIP